MNGNSDKYMACYNCGTLNVTGVKFCSYCYAAQYYNCPVCQSWVDNSFSNCPCCGSKLRWPSESYHTEYAFSPNKSTSSAVVFLLLSIAVMSIVAVNLITNNSNPVDAVSHTPAVAISNNAPSNELKVATQPSIEVLNPVTQTPAVTQSVSPASDPGFDEDYTQPSISYEIPNNMSYEIINNKRVMLNSTVTDTTGTSVPGSKSYLETAYPNWGHCSGGSCSGYVQSCQ